MHFCNIFLHILSWHGKHTRRCVVFPKGARKLLQPVLLLAELHPVATSGKPALLVMTVQRNKFNLTDRPLHQSHDDQEVGWVA